LPTYDPVVHMRPPFCVQVVLGICAAALTAGCAGSPGSSGNERVREQGRELFAPAGTRAAEEQTWAIVLAVVSGADDLVPRALGQIRSMGLPQAYAERRSDRGTAILYGRYDGPDDRAAQDDLARIRGLVVDGGAPFAHAFLAPPEVGIGGSVPQYDLRGVRAAFGPDALYTLQVGAYGRSDLKRPSPDELAEFRRLAEEAVVKLRREGERAFYFHGPNMSMVTVGVFGPDDHDPTNPLAESPELAETRRRFPNNLLNGKGVYQTVKTTQGPRQVLQRSRLVGIPE